MLKFTSSCNFPNNKSSELNIYICMYIFYLLYESTERGPPKLSHAKTLAFEWSQRVFWTTLGSMKISYLFYVSTDVLQCWFGSQSFLQTCLVLSQLLPWWRYKEPEKNIQRDVLVYLRQRFWWQILYNHFFMIHTLSSTTRNI